MPGVLYTFEVKQMFRPHPHPILKKSLQGFDLPPSVQINPLMPNINIHFLLTILLTFVMLLVGRI